MIYWLLALTSTFLIQVNNVYVSNILFFLWIIFTMFVRKKKYIFDTKAMIIFIFYLIWVLFSMIVFILQYEHFEIRNIIQFAYNIQYIILMVDGLINKEKLRRAMYVSSYILALAIIALWICKTGMMNIPFLVVHNREWAEGYIGGWPNSTVLPLLFGMYVEFKNDVHNWTIVALIRLGVLLFAILLCTSRTGYVGVAAITLYFLFRGNPKKQFNNAVVKYALYILIMAFTLYVLYSFIISDETTYGRMFMFADRMTIFSDMVEYIRNRPLLGYGGNSVDIVYEVIGPTASGYNWGHTHNTVLELLIRHGFIGALAFILMVCRISNHINSKEDKMMFWVLWGLSFLQIFYKDFVFLLLIYLLIPSKIDAYPMDINPREE